MGAVILKSGKFHCGSDCKIGENVVVNVAEECVFGDRCVVPDNAHLEGRRVEFGDDFFGYSWDWRRLDVGRGRRDDEDAVLTVGSRCTFHDNRIDLARRVTVGDDVGLSPEVVIYTHGYWMSCLEGFPCRHAPVTIGKGVIVGFRSTVLAGSVIPNFSVIGANSLVAGPLEVTAVYGGVPVRVVGGIKYLTDEQRSGMLGSMMSDYDSSLEYRGLPNATTGDLEWDYPVIRILGVTVDVEKRTLVGEEDNHSDDLRWFLFTRGIRIYTKRPFRKLEKR